MAHIEPAMNPHPQVHIHGQVPAEAAAYAVSKVEAALHHAPGPVLRTSLTLDSAAPGDRVDAHVDVDGVGVHVHAVGQTMQEATDLMQARLRSRLHHIRRRPAEGPRAPEIRAEEPVDEETAEEYGAEDR
jgi:ribosome-associated translation inhibitor RaiA